jgi:type I restriction enzyme S subunit
VYGISTNRISNVKIAFPKNLKEQKKIADCLSSLDELIAAEAQKLESYKAHKKGLMQKLFPAEGKTVPEWRFLEFRGKGEWEKKTLSDIATIRSGITPLRSESKFYDGGTIPWVKTTDLNNSFISKTEEYITSVAKVKINQADSVLVAMYGGFNQIGRTGYLTMAAATNQAISVLNPKKDEVLPIFLLAWLNTKVNHWKKIASSSRKDPNITSADVGNFPISYPCKEEQEKVIGIVSSLDELTAAQTQKLETLKTHKKSLMQGLFPSVDEVRV